MVGKKCLELSLLLDLSLLYLTKLYWRLALVQVDQIPVEAPLHGQLIVSTNQALVNRREKEGGAGCSNKHKLSDFLHLIFRFVFGYLH